ncbi:MAG: hypothetical protein LBB26_04110 [Puniceicoccales bacterium]|jgi:hypothetical protein|nr:hypothetical protein [Puniceicoccales bacterium]
MNSSDVCAAAAVPVLRRIEMLGNEACGLRAQLVSEFDAMKCTRIRGLIDEVETKIDAIMADHQKFLVVLAAINAGRMDPNVVEYLKLAVDSLRDALEKQKAKERVPDPVVRPAVQPPLGPSSIPTAWDTMKVVGGIASGGAMWGIGIGACVAGPFGAAAGAGVGGAVGALAGTLVAVFE